MFSREPKSKWGDTFIANTIQSICQGGTPHLKKLSLSGVFYTPSVMHNVIEIRLEAFGARWSLSTFVQIISEMPSLITIFLRGPLVRVTEITATPLNLPNLRYLTLEMLEPFTYDLAESSGGEIESEAKESMYLAGMLTLFSATPVKDLKLLYPFYEAHEHIFAGSSSGNIRLEQVTRLELVLHDEKWGEEAVRKFIEASPSVVTLLLNRKAEVLLDALINAPEIELAWPRLHSIYLGQTDPCLYPKIIPKVRQVVENRISCGRPLRELWLQYDVPWGIESDANSNWLQSHLQMNWVSSDDWTGVCDRVE